MSKGGKEGQFQCGLDGEERIVVDLSSRGVVFTLLCFILRAQLTVMLEKKLSLKNWEMFPMLGLKKCYNRCFQEVLGFVWR